MSDSCATETNSCVGYVVAPIVMMGLAYGLFAGSAWNALVYQVKDDQVGFVCGIGSSLLSIGLSFVPPLMGRL